MIIPLVAVRETRTWRASITSPNARLWAIALFPSAALYSQAERQIRKGGKSLQHSTDILVAGTGPAGLVAALALAGDGHKVILAGPAVTGGDRRTTTIMMPGLAFLDNLGVGTELRMAGAPLSSMRLIDATGRLFRSPTVTFRASEIGEDAFGYNIPNARLNGILEAAVMASPSIRRVTCTVARWQPDEAEIVAHLDDGSQIEAKLAAAADGRHSPAREAAGISVRLGTLPQSALVLSFTHERPHDSISTEFHTPHGPFTQVPLPDGHSSSLVWVNAPIEAERLFALDQADLAREVEARMQSMLGKVSVSGTPQLYPLSTALPSRFGARRVALIGEAAHVFPPIGAQGLNLGLRDVRDLAKSVANAPDPGSDLVLAAYDRSRRLDVSMRSGAVNALNRSLLSEMVPAQLTRSAGIGLLGAFSPLRGFFMREGMEPGSGFSRLGSALREKIGRKDAALDEKKKSGHREH